MFILLCTDREIIRFDDYCYGYVFKNVKVKPYKLNVCKALLYILREIKVTCKNNVYIVFSYLEIIFSPLLTSQL